jgi:hypothetical protein
MAHFFAFKTLDSRGVEHGGLELLLDENSGICLGHEGIGCFPRCYGTPPCGMSLGQLQLGKESVSVSQSDGRSVYVSSMDFVSALLRKSTVFELPCCSLPSCDMSCGNYSQNTDVASVNQNYAHGVKEARAEMMPQPYFVATWTHNNRSVCTIAMFLEAHVFRLYSSVYKTKVSWDTSGYYGDTIGT